MSFVEVWAIGLGLILVLMTGLWLLSLLLKNSSVVDIFWGTGFIIANWFYFALSPDGLPARQWLMGAVVTVWGLRLSLYVLYRNWGKGEDYRYRKWREEAGDTWWCRSFFQVFVLQGILMWIISAPLLAAHRYATAGLTALDFAAIPVWLVGFFFEAVGDLQLARFKADPSNQGQVLRSGLWGYTRHPNYFGDAVQWWGFYMIGATAGGWWTVFSPIIMTGLLLRVSGVALLEKSLKQRKPDYQEYIENTSAFIPWFPKNRDKQIQKPEGNNA